MRRLLRSVRKHTNQMFAPCGVEIIKSKNKCYELALYEEKERPKNPCYLNIGAGDFFHPFWHNLDTPNDYYKDLQKGRLQILHDLTSNMAFPCNSDTLKVAYSSHVIEHLSNDNVKHLFREVYRCMKPGGHFRVVCPDIDLEYDAYRRNDTNFWSEPNAYGVFIPSIAQRFLDHFASALTEAHPDKNVKKITDLELERLFASMSKEVALDSIIAKIPKHMLQGHPGDHVNWFNYNKVEALLKSAQFHDVYRSGYGQSQCPILRNVRLFDSTCPGLSLYVECRK